MTKDNCVHSIVNAVHFLLLEEFLMLLGLFPLEGLGIDLVLFSLNCPKTCGGQVLSVHSTEAGLLAHL